MNPLLPSGFDLAVLLVAFGVLVLTICAIVSIFRAPVTAKQLVGWLLIVWFVPVIGAIAWFVSSVRLRVAGQRVRASGA